jgi:hypothetical protein
VVVEVVQEMEMLLAEMQTEQVAVQAEVQGS